MKRIWYILASVLLVSMLLYSCQKDDNTSYDETLLYGKWQSGTLYYKYLSDHTGSTWDTKDDVHEDEAQPFTWQLVNSELRQTHPGDMGQVVLKYYTITELTSKTLKYKDSYNSYSFTKVN